MKRKVEFEELIDKVSLDDSYWFNECITRMTFDRCCSDCNDCPDKVKNKDDFIKKLKKGIILKKYREVGFLFKHIYDKTHYKKYGYFYGYFCNSCPYCRGDDERNSEGDTCVFLIDDCNKEKKFNLLIKSVLKGKYEKEDRDWRFNR